jgi:hypothetical protein
MDKTVRDLERAAADLLGIEAQFLAKSNSREAIGVGVEDCM